MAKYIFVVGGVISGSGKGVAAASLGLLLKSRGHKVTLLKCDPYMNTSAGILAPREHGECFVTDDGGEVDLDLGHYSRIAGINVGKTNICTSGVLYKELIEEQEDGQYLGETIQLVPHVTNKIIQRLLLLGEDHDVVISEIGGVVGDAESFAFLDSIRQFKQIHKDDVILAMVAPILWINTIKEFKTKPLQNAVKELQRHGLNPDVIFCRVDRQIPESILKKVADLTGIPRDCVFDAPDVSTIYQVPIEFYDRHVDDLLVDILRLGRSSCRIHKYKEAVEKYINNDLPTVNIGVFGKYANADEAYMSIKEALLHAGLANDVKVKIQWIKAEELESYKDMRGVHHFFEGLHGIIVPGGFDVRGVEGKIRAIRFVREKQIPFLGICLGLQCAVIEFARNVCNMEGANSIEFDTNTKYPVVHFVEGQKDLKKKCGTMRLGAYDCELEKDSKSYGLYGKKRISERHRHRYEVNPEFVPKLKECGVRIAGINPETELVELIEIDNHPFFVATQAHPEFKSKLLEPAPLFDGLIKAAIRKKNQTE